MTGAVPNAPKIYHIIHADRLESIIADGCLWCDAEMACRESRGTTIGMGTIKHRRLNHLTLTCHPDLFVGGCVPFYFCPRSVMLYVIHCANHAELSYRGGQQPIIHLEADMLATIQWAEQNRKRWAFTNANAAAAYAEHHATWEDLRELNWDAIKATVWRDCRDDKQAEFLVEHAFPWELVSRIGVMSQAIHHQVAKALEASNHRPNVEIMRDWYY